MPVSAAETAAVRGFAIASPVLDDVGRETVRRNQDFNITIFNGGKFGIGIAPQYRFAAGDLSKFDVMGRLNAGFDISQITIKVGYNYGFVNQNKGDLLTRVHNAYFTVGLAYKLF